MKRVILLLALVRVAGAQEPSPSPEPTRTDRLIEELLTRQRELENRVTLQEAALREAQRPVAPAPLPPPPPEVEPDETAPLAGYSEKNFFLRDRHSWFVLMPKGRINVDSYNFLNRPSNPPAGIVSNSAADPRSSLRDTIFLRRARIGLSGTIAHYIDFRVEGEFASIATAGQYAVLTDASLVVNYLSYLKLEAGQFYTPFTLENQTSENYSDFMEKAASTRFVVPLTRETGVQIFGELPHHAAQYWLGIFDGDGQNFKNLDNRMAVIGRGFFAPFALLPHPPGWVQRIWVGGSFWWQQATNVGGAAAPSTTGASQADIASLTTQGGFGYFNSNYSNGTDAMKNAIRSHLAPDGETRKYAVELNVPVTERFGLRAEYVHQWIDFREYNDVNPGNGTLTRTAGGTGSLAGYGAYVEAYAWVGGYVDIDRPGLYYPPHWNGYREPKKQSWAVMLAAKYEHVAFDVTGLPSVNGKADPDVGHYDLDVFELGANVWFTRHARFMANYVLNYIGNNDDKTASINETKNLFYQKAEHELLFRLDVHL